MKEFILRNYNILIPFITMWIQFLLMALGSYYGVYHFLFWFFIFLISSTYKLSRL